MSKQTANRKPTLTRNDKLLVGGASALLLVLAFAGWAMRQPVALIVAGALAFAFLLAACLKLYRRSLDYLFSSSRQNYLQLEALTSLTAMVRPRAALPRTRGMAASPDFLLKLVELIRERQPATIVETGSGTSTIVQAYMLEQAGTGRMVSLEHEPRFAEDTRRELAKHGLTNQAEVRDAPLLETEVDGQVYLWYDPAALRDVDTIDMLVIDGPPCGVGHRAREPALALLYDRLAPGAVVVVDDAVRDDEQQMVAQWTERFDFASCEHYPFEKGAYVLRKH